MKDKELIEKKLSKMEGRIESIEGHGKSHLIGFRNGLLWVLDDE